MRFIAEIDDKYLYHLIINTHLLPYDEAAEIISTHIIKKLPHYFYTEKSGINH